MFSGWTVRVHKTETYMRVAGEATRIATTEQAEPARCTACDALLPMTAAELARAA